MSQLANLLVFCVRSALSDEVILKVKKSGAPGVGAYSIDKGKARIYWPSVRKR